MSIQKHIEADHRNVKKAVEKSREAIYSIAAHVDVKVEEKVEEKKPKKKTRRRKK
jgi:hypothetical protein